MKRLLSAGLLLVVCVVLIVSIFFCVYGVCEIMHTLEELAQNPSTSGIDYLGLGWGYGIFLFALSAFGLLLSAISAKLQQRRWMRFLSMASVAVFLMLMTVAAFLFFL